MDKAFRMLIGDDEFVNRSSLDISIAGIISGISDITKIDFDLGELGKDGIYRCARFPLPQTNLAEITIARSIGEMKRHVGGDYHVVATDLQYEARMPYGGFEVLNAFKDGRAIKFLFTSTRDMSSLPLIKSSGADYIIAPHLYGLENKKHTLLGEAIGRHYIKAHTLG
ncbi:MAG: hypothetical protein Q8Q31_05320 [Nanoarchaeota archaeon]|nr:hypothetical protein [Nanoarchaeota archaeon]